MFTWLLKIKTFRLRRKKFRDWCRLEDIKFDVIQAVETSASDFPEKLQVYISTALSIDCSKMYWKDAIHLFYQIHSVNATIRKIPITDNQFSNKTDKDPWDYVGRLWYLYANVIASAYGWTQEQIAKLDVDDALAYLQEILTDKQLEKEFVWQTSEIAYPYDKRTKKSKFQALNRPYWMIRQTNTPKKVGPPLPKAMLPVGNVVRAGGNEAQKT